MEINNEELVEFFVKIEREGQEFYKTLANHISDPVTKDFLLFMSEDETRHETQFKKILGEKGNRKYGWENNPALRELIDKRFKDGFFPKLDEILEHLPKFEGIMHALVLALKCEELSVYFYEALGKQCNDLETKNVMIEIESEEKAHREYIQNLIKGLKKESI